MSVASVTTNTGRHGALAAVFALVILHGALAWTIRSPGVAWGEDDARYSLLAREMAHASYRDVWDVAAPVDARFPPGFPALVASSNALFGEHLDAQLGVLILMSATSLILLFDAARRRLGDPAAVLATGLAAINPVWLTSSGSLMSETPFRFLAILTLWAASMPDQRARHALIAAVAAVLSALVRAAGVAVIAALFLYWLSERRWKAAALLALGSLPVAGWLAWTSVAPDPDARALYLHAILPNPRLSLGTRAARLARRPLMNGLIYGRRVVPEAMSFFGMKHNALDNVFWAAVCVVAVPAGLVALWRRWRLLIALLLFYAVVLLAWPFADLRFVNPWNGFLFTLIVAGLLLTTGRFSVRVQRLSLAAVTGLFVTGAVQRGLPVLRNRLACNRADAPRSAPCYSEDQRGYLQLAEFARDSTPPDALFFAPKEGAFFYHTQRRTVSDLKTVTVPPDSLRSYLVANGVQYAVLSPIGIPRARHNNLLAHTCREFDVVRAYEGDAVLLRLRSDGPAGDDGAACDATVAWKDSVPSRWAEKP
jgi:Dolichyl-phosphate-mannose-protein mannosyltransferase